MKTTTFISGALVAVSQLHSAFAMTHIEAHGASHVLRANPLQVPSQVPTINAPRSQGCYASNGNMTEEMNGSGVSSGSCNALCTKQKYAVIALQGTSCYCGNAYPAKNDLASDDKCDYPCPAYGNEACGSLGQPGFFSIWNTGVNINPPFYEPPKPTTTAAPTATPTSDIDPNATTSKAADAGQTSSATASPIPKKKDSGPSVAGIVAGTVVGVAVVAGVVGGLFFVVRRRRNAEIEEEHRRTAAVNAFINGSKPPSTNGSISMTDSRLDPILAHRRMSDGSIADNEDYSRRILRVTNA